MIESIHNADLSGKHVLVRVDFNVPLDNFGKITDDKRIIETLPTIDEIIDKGGIPVLISHLGRPKGSPDQKHSLKPVANYLKDQFGYKVIWANDCVGNEAKKAVEDSTLGEIVLLENLRFHAEEEANSHEFAMQLAKLGDVYVNDAFGSAHRAHASTEAVAKLFDERYAGLLMIKELEYLGHALKNPRKPFVAVIGGAKISGKIDVIRHLFDRCNSILIGGGMTFTFLKAKGCGIGKSIVEEDKISMAHELMDEAKEKNVELVIPTDIVVADRFDNDASYKTVNTDAIGNEDIGMDIGEKTCKNFHDILSKAATVVWNGPMGVFEMSNFAKGTYAIAATLAEITQKGVTTIIGGGDSAAAIDSMKFSNKVSHVSTGGGAALEFLEGKILPGVAVLDH